MKYYEIRKALHQPEQRLLSTPGWKLTAEFLRGYQIFGGE